MKVVGEKNTLESGIILVELISSATSSLLIKVTKKFASVFTKQPKKSKNVYQPRN